MAKPSQSFETIAGCRISLRRAGKGETLLFLHGAGGGSIWLPFMDALSERYDLIVPEHPGYGPSDTPPWLDNVGDLAFFYLDVMEKLGLDRVHLIGASLGGWLAAEIAVRNTSRLRSLTLVAAAGVHTPGAPKGDLFLWSPEETTRNAYVDQEFAATLLAIPLTEEQKDLAMRNRLTTAKLAWQPRFYNPHLRKWLHRIDVPTHILWGDGDKIIPPIDAATYQSLIPGSTVTMIPECGHIPQVEKRDAFLSAVTGFLAKVPS